MLKVEHRTPSEINEIAHKIGEAFALDDGIFPMVFSYEEVIKVFEIFVEYYYAQDVLYTTSEKEEGYVAYYEKITKMKLRPSLHMLKRMLLELPLSKTIRLLKLADSEYEKLYKKKENYVAVSMIAVSKEYQGKGYLRKLLEDPFALAKEKNIPCVLDTDALVKAQKYMKCGMTLVQEKKISSCTTMYTLSYNDNKSEK